MQFDTVCTVKEEISKDDFLRLTLIQLGINKETPLDAVDVEFQEVHKSYREVVLCNAYVEGECTASVGYNRQEAYIAYESYREKVGDSYVTKQRPVTKYKTVTDWHPYSTHYSGKSIKAVYNNKIGRNCLDFRLEKVLPKIDADSIVMEGNAQLSDEALQTAKIACEVAVQSAEVSFPGDLHKDEHYKNTVTVESIACYILPYYEVTYTYRGQEYDAGGFACGTVEIEMEYPPNDHDITDDVQKLTKPLEAKEKTAWLLYTASFVLSIALCFVKFAWFWPVAVVLLVMAHKSTKAYLAAYQHHSDALSQDVMKSKVQALKDALEKRNMAPLSGALEGALEGYSVNGAKEPKSRDNRIKGCWIITILLVIASLIMGYNNHQEALHSVENVSVKVVSMEDTYDDSGYSTKYYVNFGYEIKSKKLGLQRIDLEVVVKDKQGNELGTISSSLQYIEVEKGKPTIINTYLAENNPQDDAFFLSLYEAELEDLEFSYKIKMAQYEDGEYAYGK